jgi:15-cis-phytoene synthase
MNAKRSMAATAALATADAQAAGQAEAAASVLRRHSRSFSIASWLLPARVRPAATALYAWCRTADDAVDNATDATTAEATLMRLDNDLDRLRQGLPIEHPASQWLAPLIGGGLIPVEPARDLLAGMRMDVHPGTIESQQDLLRYCYHAAGTVGLMMNRLMGTRQPAAVRHAIALGIAMQLTNIARDVREDAQRGRSYLPGIPDPLAADPDQVRSAVVELLNLADENYRLARSGLQYLPSDCRIAIRIALVSYREIARQIERNDYHVLAGRTVVGRVRLLVVLAAALMLGIAEEARHIMIRWSRWFVTFFSELTMDNATSGQELTEPSPVRQAKQTAFFGLSLTAIMAAALFLMVFINPKEAVYSYLPLFYSALSLGLGVLFNRCAAACD